MNILFLYIKILLKQFVLSIIIKKKTFTWGRNIFVPDAINDNEKGKIFKIIEDLQSVDWWEEIYYQMIEDEYIGTGTDTEKNNTYFQYYAELKEEFPKIFNLETQLFIDEKFEQINYFLEFIDEDSELGQ